MRRFFLLGLSVVMSFCAAWHMSARDVPAASSPHAVTVKNHIEKPVHDAISIRQKTQKEREKWLADREKMLRDLERIEAENSSLSTRCRSLDADILTARKRISLREKELQGTRQIAEDIQPFLQETLEWLSEETEQGLPFLRAERKKRLDRLRDIMDDPAVSISEKFRKLMEALLIEAEYGTTVEVVKENITLAGEQVVVNVLRLGRLNLFYQTLDGNRCGVFEMAENRWKDLPVGHSRNIGLVMDMALKRRPVELVNLPLGRISVK